ncbi:hypothetical protein GCM10020221_24760 [Streptomyces thioluteus]|uniref:Uncharacterized protein n=1 Tax=Streptomyces thioluteus TaxID=66431 RepID=A0ABN3WW90_STRTU
MMPPARTPSRGGLEGEGGGERHGIGAAGTGGQDERGAGAAGGVGGRSEGEDVVEYAADRQAYRGDRGVWTHVRVSNRSNEEPTGRGCGDVRAASVTLCA